MKVAELATTLRDAITVRRVLAKPYEKDGVTVVAAATVVGGAGGGGGHDEHGQEGEGGGFGVVARPLVDHLTVGRSTPAVPTSRA